MLTTGRLEMLTIDSAALATNPLGDPARRTVPVWLPPSYDRAPTRRYPVIYWLAGFTGTGAGLFQGTPWQPSLGDRLSRLTASGQMGEVIVVAPDCFTRFGGSQYLDSSATGLYETHLCHELIAAVDARFRTVADRNARGIGGKSSGGFGALVLAMRHPDLFAAVASHAGDAYFELSMLPDIAKAFRVLRKHGGIEPFLRHFDGAPTKRSEDIATIMMLAVSAAYAPDPAAPHGFALPFDPQTGELVAAVWKRFKAWDPVELIATHAEALRAMRLVFVDAGTRDEYALDLGARVLVARMRAHGITVEHQEFDDGHMNTAYRYEVSLPKVAAALGATGGAS
ncbi:MAG TPA: alpha/beta hydrolase-fold protein [Polyangia bacterium]|nr:alpha/beta hydrolase-fold protein [Polyangia bacterium]